VVARIGRFRAESGFSGPLSRTVFCIFSIESGEIHSGVNRKKRASVDAPSWQERDFLTMIPMECVVCGKQVQCDLVHFRTTRAGLMFRRQVAPGHDPDEQWFCARHVPYARVIADKFSALRGVPLVRRHYGYPAGEYIPDIFPNPAQPNLYVAM
jgi:hypothetical protein